MSIHKTAHPDNNRGFPGKLSGILLATALAAVPAAPVWAYDIGPFNIRGYGTIGAVRTDTNKAQFRPTQFHPNGADRSEFDFGVDSKIGLQITGKINPEFSATLQMLSQKNEDNNFNPRPYIGFVKWQPNPDLAVRVGRLGWSVFLATDSLTIGYTNPWIRPPVDVYGQVPMYTIDGIDVIWQMNFGNSTFTVQPMFGDTHFDLPSPVGGAQIEGKSDNLFGINLILENGPWTVRGGVIQTRLDMNQPMVNSIFNNLRMAAPTLPAAGELVRSLEANNARGNFGGIGVIYNSGNILLQSEYTLRRTKSFMADTTGWYVTGGYRFGKVMPYATYAKVKIDSPLSDSSIQNSGGPAMLSQAVNTLLQTGNNGQQTTSLGVRWDFAKNTAFKAQFDHIRLQGAGSTGFLVNVRSGYDGPVNVFSAAIDFVF